MITHSSIFVFSRELLIVTIIFFCLITSRSIAESYKWIDSEGRNIGDQYSSYKNSLGSFVRAMDDQGEAPNWSDYTYEERHLVSIDKVDLNFPHKDYTPKTFWLQGVKTTTSGGKTVTISMRDLSTSSQLLVRRLAHNKRKAEAGFGVTYNVYRKQEALGVPWATSVASFTGAPGNKKLHNEPVRINTELEVKVHRRAYESSCALSLDGTTLYVGSWSGFHALKASNGVRKWKFGTQRFEATPAVGVNGIVYISTGSNFNRVEPALLYALDGNTGKLIWEFNLGAGCPSISPAIGFNGTVYVGSKKGLFYALNGLTGEVIWKFDVGGCVMWPVIGKKGMVYASPETGGLFALDGATGDPIWIRGGDKLVQISNWARDKQDTYGSTLETVRGPPISGCPAIGSDGTIFFREGYGIVLEGVLIALDGITGKLRWKYTKEDSGTSREDPRRSPIIGPNGNIFDKIYNEPFKAFDTITGKMNPNFNFKVSFAPTYTNVIGMNGNFINQEELFTKANQTWNASFIRNRNYYFRSSPLIGPNGNLYSTVYDTELHNLYVFAMETGNNAPPNSWSMLKGNSQRTGNAYLGDADWGRIASEDTSGLSRINNSIKLDNDWMLSNWFGYFWEDNNTSWVYHEILGWIFIHQNEDESVWFYHNQQKDWFWTKNEIYSFLYSHNQKKWAYSYNQLPFSLHFY